MVSAQDGREARVRWIAAQILPHEADVRAWLRGRKDADDVIQEAYCRLSELADHRHIENGRAYFFATVRSILIQAARRTRIASIDAIDDSVIAAVPDEAPSPERDVAAQLQLHRVMDLIAALPPAYRHALEMRRVHGLSQREAARYLGVTEKVVENNALRGLRLLMKWIAGDEARGDDARAEALDGMRDAPVTHVRH
jgi:RNA polymerase sigma factor (sigma-70 family)